MAKIAIKQIKSAIGRTKNQKLTLEALGLKKVNHIVEHEASASVLGMVRTVSNLVEVQEK